MSTEHLRIGEKRSSVRTAQALGTWTHLQLLDVPVERHYNKKPVEESAECHGVSTLPAKCYLDLSFRAKLVACTEQAADFCKKPHLRRNVSSL